MQYADYSRLYGMRLYRPLRYIPLSLNRWTIPDYVDAWNCLWMRMFDTNYAYNKRIKSIHLHISDGCKSFVKHLWATPTHHTWFIFDSISSRRSQTLLPIQLYYEENTCVNSGKSKKDQSKEYDCNPVFVETLMGFPLGWTHLP